MLPTSSDIARAIAESRRHFLLQGQVGEGSSTYSKFPLDYTASSHVDPVIPPSPSFSEIGKTKVPTQYTYVVTISKIKKD